MRNNSFVINDGIQPRVFPSYLRDLMRPAEVQRLVDAFNAFARPIDSYYFLVLCPAQHRERVKKAAEEYVQDLLKEK